MEVPDLDDFTLPIGKAKVARQGEDVTIVSYARGMMFALAAAEHLFPKENARSLVGDGVQVGLCR